MIKTVWKIHKVSSPSQSSNVSIGKKLADVATRYLQTAITTSLKRWITRPQWLKILYVYDQTVYPFINPETDK